MSSAKYSKLVRLDARLKLHKQHPILFNLIALAIVFILSGAVLLIKWVLR